MAPAEESSSQKFINTLLRNAGFDIRYREQLERVSATGTAGAYIYLQDARYVRHENGTLEAKGGTIRINYVDADSIIPLTVDNKTITECAFCATNIVKGKEKTTLVLFTLEKGRYTAETAVFNELGERQEAESIKIQLGEVKPFAIMTNAEVNNLDNMEGYGFPKIYGAIPIFKVIDLCFNVLFSDISKADKIVLINEALSEVRDANGSPTLTPQQKEIFVMLGEKLPGADSLVQEYNPKIRIDEITKVFELALSLLSMQFGYGTKKYTFENGQIKTATEYIGTKQDAMQELNKQRRQAEVYIGDIIHAAMWFSNQFLGTGFNVEENLSIEFDDSYVEDRQSKLEAMRADAVTFAEIPWLTFMYIKTKYNLSDEDAKKYIQEGRIPEDEESED